MINYVCKLFQFYYHREKLCKINERNNRRLRNRKRIKSKQSQSATELSTGITQRNYL